MRLTLRTLLAWRDGLVQEPEAGELAAKVSSSTVAPRLVERMTELGARADLAAPSDDPNPVAEFLDNTLPGHQLEAFERTCLESELHLAEAADCHSLLAELLRDGKTSVALDSASIERLLQVVKNHGSPPVMQTDHGDEAALGDLMRQANAVAARPMARVARPSAGASLGAWLSVGAAVVLLIVLGGLLVRSIWLPGGRPRSVALAERPREVGLSDTPAVPTSREVPLPPVAKQAEPAVDHPAETVPTIEPAIESDPAGDFGPGPSPPIVDRAPSTPLPAEQPVIPLPVIEAAGEPFAEDAEAPGPAESVAPQPVTQASHAMRLVAGGPLLHRVGTGNDGRWRAVAAEAALAGDESFAVPFYAYPQIVRGDVFIRLLPGSRGTLTSDRDGTIRLEIAFGRAVVWTEAASAQVGVTAGGLSGVFTLGPRQPVGIDVELMRDRGTDPAVIPPAVTTTIVTTGGGRFRQSERDGGPPGVMLAGLEPEQPVPPRGGLTWESAAAGAARVMPIAHEPAWMKQTGPARAIERHASEGLAMALAGDVPATDALRIAGDSRRVEVRMAAAATLALMEEYDGVVALLCDESPARKLREGEWDALEAMTVPLALARGATSAAALRQAFAKQGPAGREAELFLLARGLSADELAAGGAEALVKALEDSSLVVRRYALANLTSLLSDPAQASRNYRPDRASLLNDKGIAWWRGQLEAGRLGAADPKNTP